MPQSNIQWIHLSDCVTRQRCDRLLLLRLPIRQCEPNKWASYRNTCSTEYPRQRIIQLMRSEAYKVLILIHVEFEAFRSKKGNTKLAGLICPSNIRHSVSYSPSWLINEIERDRYCLLQSSIQTLRSLMTTKENENIFTARRWKQTKDERRRCSMDFQLWFT